MYRIVSGAQDNSDIQQVTLQCPCIKVWGWNITLGLTGYVLVSTRKYLIHSIKWFKCPLMGSVKGIRIYIYFLSITYDCVWCSQLPVSENAVWKIKQKQNKTSEYQNWKLDVHQTNIWHVNIQSYMFTWALLTKPNVWQVCHLSYRCDCVQLFSTIFALKREQKFKKYINI